MVDSAYFQKICLYFSMRGVSGKSYLLPSFIGFVTRQLILWVFGIIINVYICNLIKYK